MTIGIIKYGTVEANFDNGTIPEQTVRAMLSRGVTHYFGSEQASKVGPNSSWAEKFEKDNKRKPTDAEREAQKAANLAAAHKAFLAGEIGMGRGPKLDPVEAEIEAMAEREVWNTLADNDLCKRNKKPKDDEVFTFADGSTKTFETMVDGKIAKYGENTYRPAAIKKIAAEKKATEARAAKAKAAKDAGRTVTADNLDL